MGSLENFHQEIMRRLQSSELQLGGDQGDGRRTLTRSPSRSLWTLFSFLCRCGLVSAIVCEHLDGTRGGGSSSARLVAFFGRRTVIGFNR